MTSNLQPLSSSLLQINFKRCANKNRHKG